MGQFLTGKELNTAIYKIIWEAEQNLLLVSPFIKLDDYFKKLLDKHKHNPKLHICIIFGKNEGSPGKSLRKEDIEFLKEFKNISIVYCANLHAKYYGNETKGIITSINLYDKSFENNIEFGVFYELPMISLSKTADQLAYNYSVDMANSNPAIFVKRPVYERSLLGSLIGQKSYISSQVLYDQTEELIKHWYKWENETKRFLHEFEDEIDAKQKKAQMPIKEEKIPEKPLYPKPEIGYCIRTGIQIPFNYKMPMCPQAYQSWSMWKNWNYPEKYCHATGKPSNGKTSMAKPILN
jgi:hypothetical protein